jgi:hypothetical protein
MSSVLKSAIVSIGLLTGVAATAQAQSVSALPPAGGVQAAPAPATSSPQAIYPKPGGNSVWQEEHYQAQAGYDADKAQHPYSTSIGPKPGAHSSGGEEGYKPTEADSNPARHPYTAPIGPKPGG